MLSLWDMLIASNYPHDLKYFYLGLIVFLASLIISICIIPYVIHSIWTIVKPVGERRALFANKEHDYNHYRITLSIFISVVILQVVSAVICFHSIYFLMNIILYRKYIVGVEESGQDFSGYNIPSNHYILYVFEATFEAAREALLLWGFLFLVNYICKLVIQKFYFKTYSLLLVLRVGFVFVCSLRIPELIANTGNTPDNEAFKQLLLDFRPFQTLAKSLRSLEILINLLLCTIFVVFLWRSIREKMDMIENRPDGQPASPFNSRIGTLCDTREMRRIKKYSILYLVLLTTELLLNLIQCQFPNFVVRRGGNDVGDTVLWEIILAVITDVLSFILPILTVLFIIILMNSMGRTFQNNPPNYGSIAQSDEVSIPFASAKPTCKTLLVNGGIVLAVAIVVTAFTSYIWFANGNRAHVVLRPGDWIRLDDTGSDLQDFMNTCNTVMAERNVEKEFTVFDMKDDINEDYFTPKSCLYNQSVLFFKSADKQTNQSKFIADQTILGQSYWLQSGTFFDNFSVPERIDFTVYYYPEPCYLGNRDVTGFLLTCENRSYPEEYLSCENGSNCTLTRPGMYRIHLTNDTTGQVTFSWHRPMFVGPNMSYHDITENVKDFKVLQFENVEMEDYMDSCSVYLVCYIATWKAGIYTVCTFVVVVVYLSAMLLLFTCCKTRLLKC